MHSGDVHLIYRAAVEFIVLGNKSAFASCTDGVTDQRVFRDVEIGCVLPAVLV